MRTDRWSCGLRLIVVTDAELALPRTVLSVVEAALDAGAPAIQLREKHLPVARAAPIARELRNLTSRYDALLFVNDRVDLAMVCGADGVHVGPDDLPVDAVRRVAGDGLLVGYSASTPEEALTAAQAGADYIGCGSVFPTRTKADAGMAIGTDGLSAVVAATDLPVVGIGGIGIDNVALLPDTGAAGAAVVGAVMTADDVGAAVRALLAPWPRGSEPHA